ncbi:unnamed protein product [marine sediment metagenome]|uniref:Uncharacterized protein n=1 Tax=marine sediment metagenome TaxID=412755 RepID=X1GM19_9ZZZZ
MIWLYFASDDMLSAVPHEAEFSSVSVGDKPLRVFGNCPFDGARWQYYNWS